MSRIKTSKVFLDDLRHTPPGWLRVYTAWEAITLCEEGRVDELSLDYDLNDNPNLRGHGYGENVHPGTGGDVTRWLLEQAWTNRWAHVPPIIRIHSINEDGICIMAVHLAAIERMRFVKDGTPPEPHGLW